MINTQDIDGIIGSEAVDQDNDRIGKVGQVYLDSDSDQPVWVTVKSGLFGTSETLVPLDGANWDQQSLHLAFSKDRVKDAPRVEPDAELSPEEQDRLYDYYGLQQGGAATGGTGAGTTSSIDDTTTRTGSTVDDTADGTLAADGSTDVADGAAASGAAGAGYVDDTATTDTTGRGASYDDTATTGAVDDTATTAAGTGTGTVDDAITTGVDRSAGYDTSGPTTDDAMTRSEERLHVGTEQVQTGRARLRKHVVTEQQTVTVPVSHEEVRIEREPITDANIGNAVDGPELSEEEHEVVLTEERPVVEKETVPVERVRLGTEQVTEQREVTEDVRHEEITTDGADGADDADGTRAAGGADGIPGNGR